MEYYPQSVVLDSFFRCDPLGANCRTRSRHFSQSLVTGGGATLFYAAVGATSATQPVPIATLLRQGGITRCMYLYASADLAPYQGGITTNLYGVLRATAREKGIPVFDVVEHGALPSAGELHTYEGKRKIFNSVFCAGIYDVLEDINARILSVFRTPSNKDAAALCKELSTAWVQHGSFIIIPYHHELLQDMGASPWLPDFRLSDMNMEVERFSPPMLPEEVREARVLRRATMFINSQQLLDAFVASKPYEEGITAAKALRAALTARNTVLVGKSRRTAREKKAMRAADINSGYF